MADDINKTTQELKKELSQLKDEVEKGKRGLKPAFKELVDLVKESNAPLAKSIIDVREASKNTFAGALQSRKLLQIGNLIGQVSKDASKVSADQMTQLKKFTDEIEGFDLDRFIKSQEAVNAMNDKLQGIDDSYAARLQTQLSNDKELKKLDDGLQDSNRMLNEVRKSGNKKDIYEYEQLIIEQQKDRTKYIQAQKEIFNQMIEEEKQSIVDKNETEINIRDEYNDILKQGLKDVSEDNGQFFTDFKKIFGVDLQGPLDSAVEWTNAFGRMFFKNEDLVGDIFSGLSSFKEKAINGLTNGLKSLPDLGKKMMNAIGGSMAAIGGVVAKGVDATVLGIQKSWSFVKDKASSLATATGDMIGKAGGAIKKGAATVAKGAANMIKAAASFLAASFTALMSGLMFLAPYILIGVAIVALVGALIAGAMWLEEKTGIFSGLFETVKSYFMNIIEAIGRIFGGFYDFFAGLFTGDFDRMFGGLKDILGGLWDLIKAPFTAIGDFFKNVFGVDIGQILVDFAKKVLPDWVLNWLGWGGGEDSAPDMQNTDDPGSEQNARELSQAERQAEWERRRREGNRRELGGRREGFMGIGSETDEEYNQRLAKENENRSLLKDQINIKRQEELLRVGDNAEMQAAINARYDEMSANADAGVDLFRISRQVGFQGQFERDMGNVDVDQIRAAINPMETAPGVNPTPVEVQEASGRGGEIGQATQDVADAQSDVNMQVNTVQQNTNNVSNSSTVTASTGRTRNSDPTASRVAAVPA